MLKNLISSFFAKGTVAFTMLAILLIQSRQLGGAEVGRVSLLILNLAIIQTINDIYTGPALVYFIPKHSLGRIYKAGLLWTCGCIILINILFYYLPTLRDKITGSSLSIETKDLWLHVFVLSFVSTLQAFHNVILLAKEKISVYNFLVFFQPLLLLVALIVNVFVFRIVSVNAYLIAAYVSWITSLLISTFFVLACLKKDAGEKPAASIPAILKNGFVNQLGNLAHILSNRYNYYMIGAAALLGVYASATSLIESVWILSGSISPIVLTYIANRRNAENKSRVTFLLSKISFLLSAVCVLIVFLVPADFFTFLLGKDFSGTKTIMLYLSPGVLCISFSSIISHYFSGLGQRKVLLLANASGLLVTLCTSYLLISRFGLIGACYAASLSYFTQSLVLTIVFMKQNQLGWIQLFRFREDLGVFIRRR